MTCGFTAGSDDQLLAIDSDTGRLMTAANSNEGLSETEGFVESVLDDLVAEAAEEGTDGPLEPRTLMIEMAARALARVVLDYGVMPAQASEMMNGRLSHILMDEVERSRAKLPPNLSVVR